LGPTGLKVSRLGLGTMNFGWHTGEAEAIRLVHKALEAGINFFDTADIYSQGKSEAILGKALKGRRDKAVIATKVGGAVGPDSNDSGGNRRHLFRQVEASLRRLQTDYIDLYQLHHRDPDTPLEETLGALSDLARQGKILYGGTTNLPAWEIVEGQLLSSGSGGARPVSHQNSYSLIDRRAEIDIIPVCRKYRLGLIVWSPLGGGWLGRTFSPGDSPHSHPLLPTMPSKPSSPEARALGKILARLNTLSLTVAPSLSQFAISWVLSNPAVGCVLIGPQNSRHFRDSLGALELTLPPAVLSAADHISYPGTTALEF